MPLPLPFELVCAQTYCIRIIGNPVGQNEVYLPLTVVHFKEKLISVSFLDSELGRLLGLSHNNGRHDRSEHVLVVVEFRLVMAATTWRESGEVGSLLVVVFRRDWLACIALEVWPRKRDRFELLQLAIWHVYPLDSVRDCCEIPETFHHPVGVTCHKFIHHVKRIHHVLVTGL